MGDKILYEKPKLIVLSGHAKLTEGVCKSGSGDSSNCGTGNSAGASCMSGTSPGAICSTGTAAS
jgi:hypothetical protein